MIDSLPFKTPPPAGFDPFASMAPSLIIGSLVSVIPIWFLIARRQAFIKPPELPVQP